MPQLQPISPPGQPFSEKQPQCFSGVQGQWGHLQLVFCAADREPAAKSQPAKHNVTIVFILLSLFFFLGLIS